MVTPRGPETVVNSYTAQWQEHPDIATLGNGDFVVVWDSFFSEGDEDPYYIAGQLYDAAGIPKGDEIVLSDPALEARYPSVTALGDGGFAIGWEAGSGSVLARTDIYTSSFNADFSVRSAPARVSPAIDDDFYGAEAAALAGGRYVVFYTGDETQADGTFADDGIYGRIIGTDGRPTGGAFKVNATGRDAQQNPKAAQLSNGNTVVIWDSESTSINSVGNGIDDVRARIYGPDGLPVGPEFRIAPENDGVAGGFNLTKTEISVAALSGGRFVATWYNTELDFYANGDTSYQILGRIFGPDGTPQGPIFKANTTDDSVPDHSGVAGLDGGGFVVVWDHPSRVAGVGDDVFGQLYSDTGRRIGDEFLVPSDLSNAQEWASVTALDGAGSPLPTSPNSSTATTKGSPCACSTRRPLPPCHPPRPSRWMGSGGRQGRTAWWGQRLRTGFLG